MVKTAIRMVIAFCLIGPFLLREADRTLEPYPAVLQPSGAYKVSTKDAVKFRKKQLLAVENDGSEHEIHTDDFMGDIPSHYWSYVADSRYGLASEKERTVALGRWRLTLVTHKEASPTERKEALRWIHARLRAQGIDDAAIIRIREIDTFWDVQSGTEVKRETKEQIDVDIKK